MNANNSNPLRLRDGNPLRYAAERGHLEIINFLVSKGADTKNKNMALGLAAQHGHLEVVKYLESVGAKAEAE